MEQVVAMTGVDKDVAEAALKTANGDIVVAIESLTTVPAITGAKYIPPPPKIDDGHSEETREQIRQGRILADIFSASAKNDLRGKASHYPVQQLSAIPESTEGAKTG